MPQLPAYNPGEPINWSPLNDAFSNVAKTAYQNSLLGLQQRASDRADKQLALDTATQNQALIDAQTKHAQDLANIYGSWAQSTLGIKDPTAKTANVKAMIGSHPEWNSTFAQNGVDPNNTDQVLSFITSASANQLSEINARKAQSNLANAEAAKAGLESRMLGRNVSLMDSLLGGRDLDAGGGSGVPASGVPQQWPGGGASPPSSPPGNALSRVTSATPAPPPGNALSAPGSSLGPPGGDSNYLSGFSAQANRMLTSAQPPPPSTSRMQGIPAGDAVPGTSVSPPSTSLPNPGDPTSFSGSSASGVTTPSRLSPDTQRTAMFDLAFNGGKGMSSILNNDPGSKYATKYAEQTASDNASLNFKQKMTTPLLAQIQHMRQLAIDAGPDVLSEATGPDYAEGANPESWFPTIGADTSGQRYQNVRAAAQAWNYPGRAINAVFPGYGSYPAQTYSDAAKLNLQFQHMKKMLGAQVKALPGTKGGGASTDQDQALVLDAVGEALHAQDPETFFKILFDAENGLRARAGIGAIAQPKSYLPDSWNAGANNTAGSPTPATAQVLAGARDAISKGADPQAVRQRLIDNGINADGL